MTEQEFLALEEFEKDRTIAKELLRWKEVDGQLIPPTMALYHETHGVLPYRHGGVLPFWWRSKNGIFDVEEEMWNCGFDLELESFLRSDVVVGKYFRVIFRKIVRQEDCFLAFSASLQHAVYLAALMAKGVIE